MVRLALVGTVYAALVLNVAASSSTAAPETLDPSQSEAAGATTAAASSDGSGNDPTTLSTTTTTQTPHSFDHTSCNNVDGLPFNCAGVCVATLSAKEPMSCRPIAQDANCAVSKPCNTAIDGNTCDYPTVAWPGEPKASGATTEYCVTCAAGYRFSRNYDLCISQWMYDLDTLATNFYNDGMYGSEFPYEAMSCTVVGDSINWGIASWDDRQRCALNHGRALTAFYGEDNNVLQRATSKTLSTLSTTIPNFENMARSQQYLKATKQLWLDVVEAMKDTVYCDDRVMLGATAGVTTAQEAASFSNMMDADFYFPPSSTLSTADKQKYGFCHAAKYFIEPLVSDHFWHNVPFTSGHKAGFGGLQANSNTAANVLFGTTMGVGALSFGIQRYFKSFYSEFATDYPIASMSLFA